jgi:hypothetical protein
VLADRRRRHAYLVCQPCGVHDLATLLDVLGVGAQPFPFTLSAPASASPARRSHSLSGRLMIGSASRACACTRATATPEPG